MTENNHQITPPPELVQQWWAQETYDPFGVAISNLATQAAQWGADAELEAILALAGREIPEQDRYFDGFTAASIRHDRRPKPPSLKEQALEILGYPKDFWSQEEVDTIRRALEHLDD